MLQKVDKDRLTNVLEVIKKAGVRHPNATITRELGFDNGMVSNYLNGKKPISDKFYSTVMQHFGGVENAERPDELSPPAIEDKKTMDLFTDMVQNCTRLTGSIDKVVDNNTVLTGVIKSLFDKINLAAPGRPVTPISEYLQPALELIARHVVEQKIFLNYNDAMNMLGKALVSGVTENAQ